MNYSFWREGLLIIAVSLAVASTAGMAFKRGNRSAGYLRLAIAGGVLLLGGVVAITSIEVRPMP